MSERMTAEQTPDIEATRRAIAAYVCNVSNLPEPLQAPALGIGMGGLIDGLTQALAPVLAAAVREARAAELREAADALNADAVGFKPGGWGSNPVDQQTLRVAVKCVRWLRARADRIAVDAPEGGA